MGDHNGSHSRCWGYSAEFDGNLIDNHLPDCEKCSVEKVKKLNNQNHKMTACKKANKLCGKWIVTNIKFPTPKSYPQTHDKRRNAPKPPVHRVPGIIKTLNGVKVESDWLRIMLTFSHHNVKTNNPSTGRPFWNKTSALAYMRVCTLNKSKQLDNYNAARNGEKVPIPVVWMKRNLF